MRVLSIISSGYEQGGAETATVIYNRALRALGHETKIISSDVRPDLAHYSDYEFKSVPAHGLKSITSSLFNLSSFKVTRRVLREFRPDVVVLNTMQEVSPSVLFLLRKYPTIQFVHGPEAFTTSLLSWHMQKTNFKNGMHDLRDLTLIGKLKYVYLRSVFGSAYKFGFKSVNRFMVFSNYMKQLLERDGITKPIEIITCGIDLIAAPSRVSSRPIIGFAGRLEYFKGVDDLLDAMPAVLARQPTAKLIIAGDGPENQRLRAKTSALGIEKNVTFKGHVSQMVLRRLYAQMTVFVMPSRWSEVFGKVGIEAMSAGTPVVATAVGGVSEWLHDGKNGLLAPPSNPQKLAECIIELLDSPARRNDMSKQSRKTAEAFSNDAYIADMLRVMKEVVAE